MTRPCEPTMPEVGKVYAFMFTSKEIHPFVVTRIILDADSSADDLWYEYIYLDSPNKNRYLRSHRIGNPIHADFKEVPLYNTPVGQELIRGMYGI